MKPSFERYVALANQGARELGFADTGAMWRSNSDMDPATFAQDCDRVWAQVRPLYQSLHAYARRRLGEKYGTDRVPASGPIPAHLLGNMWAQSWEGIYPLLAPPAADPGVDLTQILVTKATTAEQMVRSRGAVLRLPRIRTAPGHVLDALDAGPAEEREVVCHASAWDLDYEEDLRIKMCIEITADDFQTIHHELGHNYYQRAYRHQPFIYRDSANDGFHEAIGDTIGLSITPEYLVKIGLLEAAPPAEKDIGLLLARAIEKVAFLPFGLLVDQWRWKVFSGEIPPERYNSTWWELKRQYPGSRPRGRRSEQEFDPGAKLHVTGSVPYMRYFLAHLLQFQFHRALAREIGWTGPVHRASIYGNPAAGQRLRDMLAMGCSRPWPEALASMTGERSVDGTALLEVLRPVAAVARRAEPRAPGRLVARGRHRGRTSPAMGPAASRGGRVRRAAPMPPPTGRRSAAADRRWDDRQCHDHGRDREHQSHRLEEGAGGPGSPGAVEVPRNTDVRFPRETVVERMPMANARLAVLAAMMRVALIPAATPTGSAARRS